MKKYFLLLIVLIILTGIFILTKFEKEAFRGTAGSSNVPVEFTIVEGEGSTEVGENLAEAGLVKSKNYFYYYVWRTETSNKLQAGPYELSTNMTIGEIVEKMTGGEIKSKILKLTVPEGFTNEKIVNALREKRPIIADEFEKLATCKCLNQEECGCDKFSSQYKFIRQIPQGVDLEGYLFPDTYFIDEEETGATLISKFLNNFKNKVTNDMLREIDGQGRSLHEAMTMASIVEREVNTSEDRKLVAGLFWQRLTDNFPLQSDATLSYILNEDRIKFYNNDIQVESPYNTYLNTGLPPGPIANPGLDSISATIYPQESDYYYFLSNPETGETVFSKTNEEHGVNKEKHGL